LQFLLNWLFIDAAHPGARAKVLYTDVFDENLCPQQLMAVPVQSVDHQLDDDDHCAALAHNALNAHGKDKLSQSFTHLLDTRAACAPHALALQLTCLCRAVLS
jgi:hypothetical protein